MMEIQCSSLYFVTTYKSGYKLFIYFSFSKMETVNLKTFYAGFDASTLPSKLDAFFQSKENI